MKNMYEVPRFDVTKRFDVNILCGAKRDWILRKLEEKIKVFEPHDMRIHLKNYSNKKNTICYYITYRNFKKKSNFIDVVFFTHPSNDSFYKKAKICDHCVVMCEKYKKEFIDIGVEEEKITVIYPGVDSSYKPVLKILQPVKMDVERRKRKGLDLWKKVLNLPYVEGICTQGNYSENDLLNLYKNTDVVLSTSNLEGGPMCIIEGLAVGKTVIAPRDVGFINDINGVITYEKNNFNELRGILEKLYSEKLKISDNVKFFTWENWANEHYKLFRKLEKS